MLQTPARYVAGQPIDHVDGKANELVSQNAASAQTRSTVAVIGDGDARARTHIVVSIEVEEPDGAGIVVPLQVAANLVVAISQAVRKKPAL